MNLHYTKEILFSLLYRIFSLFSYYYLDLSFYLFGHYYLSLVHIGCSIVVGVLRLKLWFLSSSSVSLVYRLFSLRFSWEFLSLGLLLVLGTVNLCFGDVHFFFAVFSSVCNFCLLVYRLLFCFLYAVSFCVSIKWWLNKG